MAAVRGADRGDPGCMTRNRQPIVDRGANPPALDRWAIGPGVPRNQQQHSIAGADRPLQGGVDRAPRVGEVVAMQVEDPVGARPESKQPLKSAASLRKQRRAFSRQPVEVSWERPAGVGIGFIITTVVLAAGVLALMLIALYLR